MEMEKKLLFIINPVSGRRIYHRSLADAIRVFEDQGWTVDAYLTEARGDAADMAAMLGPGYDRVVCLGGDGTLSEVINGLASLDFSVPLGYIPAGSTNDFASSMDVSRDFISAALDAAIGRERMLDVLRIGGRCFVNAATIGIFTSVAYTAPQSMKNAVGGLAYLLNGIKDLSRLHTEHIRLTTGEDVYEDDYLFGMICNSSTMSVVGRADENYAPDDGFFDALFIKKPATLAELHKTVSQLLGGHYPSDTIDFFHADSMGVETPVPAVWSVDGERYDGGNLAEVSVLHRRLRFIVRPDFLEKDSALPLKGAGRWRKLELGKNRPARP